MSHWSKDSKEYINENIQSGQWLCNSDFHFAKTLWYLWKEELTPQNQHKIEENKKKIITDLQSKYEQQRNMNKLFTLCLRKKNEIFTAREIRQNFLTTNEFLNKLVEETRQKNKFTFNSNDMTISNLDPKKLAFQTLFRAVFKHNDKYYCFALPSSSKQAFLTNTKKSRKDHVYGKKVDNGGEILADVSEIEFTRSGNLRVYWNAQEFFNSKQVREKIQSQKKIEPPFYVTSDKSVFQINNTIFQNFEAFAENVENVIQEDQMIQKDLARKQKENKPDQDKTGQDNPNKKIQTPAELEFLDRFPFLTENSRHEIRHLLHEGIFMHEKNDSTKKPKTISWCDEFLPTEMKTSLFGSN